jgi:hypothetical protein
MLLDPANKSSGAEGIAGRSPRAGLPVVRISTANRPIESQAMIINFMVDEQGRPCACGATST